jgi:CBS domain-containing protein
MLAKDLVLEDVVKIDAGKDILDALFTMFTTQQYILPVFKDSKFVGVLNISHYAKVLHDLKDKRPGSIHVGDIMDYKTVSSISPTADVKQVMDKLCEKGVYGIPVTSGHEFLGIIRRQDLLKNFLHLIKGRFKVMDVMSYHITTSSIHDPIESVVKRR